MLRRRASARREKTDSSPAGRPAAERDVSHRQVVVLVVSMVVCFLTILLVFREKRSFVVQEVVIPVGSPETKEWNAFESCAWRDPGAVMLLRMPKAASTSLVNAVTSLSESSRRFRTRSLPEYPLAVGFVPENGEKYGCKGSQWKPRCSGLVGRNFERKTKRTVEYVALNDTHRVFVYGHVFYAKGTSEVASIISTARDPMQRLASDFYYANSKKMNEDLSLGACAENDDCANKRDLGRLCSLQALYFCGYDDVCGLDLDGVASDATVSRALEHINSSQFLTIIPTNYLDSNGFDLLATLLPHYFDGLKNIRLPPPKRAYDSRAERKSESSHPQKEDGHKWTIGATPSQRRAVNHLCRQDQRVYDAILNRFQRQLNTCAVGGE